MADFYRFTDDEVAECATKPDNNIWPSGKDWNTYCLASEVSELRAEIVRLRALWGAERSEVERLRAAIDSFVAEVDDDHQPEWASEQAKANGKKAWGCRWCGPQDGGWPCCHRMALDELKEARRG